MGLTLREALKSLCSNSDWNYAVFWKLKPQNRMILTWEDGYCESTKPPGISNFSTLTAPDSLLKGWDTGGNRLDYGAHGVDVCSMADQMQLFMTQMSCQTYSLGEGIIGHSAFSGKHRWVFQENCLHKGFSFGSQNGCSNLEYPAGWKNQFAAGIRTIAVIAAAHGVVQLGSKQTIIENLEFVSHVKALFRDLHNVVGAFSRDSIPELFGGRIHGTQPRVGMRSGTLLHGITQSIPKIQCSNVVLPGGGSLPVVGMTKGLQAEVHVSPTICSSSGSNKAFSHLSQLQQKGIQLGSPTMSSEQEAISGDTRALPSAKVMLPFQDAQQANFCGTDNHQAFLIQSSRGSNGLSLMEQRLVKEMGLQGQLPLLLSNGKSAVHTSFHDITQSDFQQTAVLNSTFRTVESNNCGRNLQSNLIESIRGEGMLRADVFQPGTPHPSTFKQTEMQPSVPVLQPFVQTKKPAASSIAPAQSNPVVGIDQNKRPLAEVNINHLLFKAPIFSSANMEAPVSDARQCQASSASWCNTSGQLETFLETVRNDPVPSVGVNFSMAAPPHGIEPQPWDKEIIMTKDISSSFLQDSMVDNLSSLRESSKVSEAAFGELLPVTDEYGYNGCDDFDKYLKSLMKGQDNSNSSISPPAADEIFDALGPVCRNGQDHVVWDDMLLPVGDGSSANFSSYAFGVSAGTGNPSDPSIDRNLQGGIFSERKSEHLLDAVVANICAPVNQSTDGNMSTEHTISKLSSAPSLYSASVKVDSCSTGPLIGCEQKQSDFVGHSQSRDDADIKNLQNSSFTNEFQRERAVKRSLNDSSLKFQPSSWVEDCHSVKSENLGLAQTKKSDEPVKMNRKRAKPGESTRPRPKDRQQIQDRVRELREIVPNGTKCSIDTLLERTIKHMVFLQSVTKHAEKLKQNSETKVLDKDGGFLSKGNLEGGASWAVELGGQTVGCPIIVENMSQPRQLLIEMLCEERGLFLEIADIIRGLGLTILKGVMEARSDKIWARFVVEAIRDVQRVDILWSLMQLLQQNTTSNLSLTHQPSVITHQGMWFSNVQCVSATSDASHL